MDRHRRRRVAAWFAILFTRRYPRGLFDFVVGVGRWRLRVLAYAVALLTDVYPPVQVDAVTGRPVRVLLADVSGAGRNAIAALLRSLPGIVLVADVGSADELARERSRTAPDVVLIDDRLLAAAGPQLGGADVAVIVMGLDDDPSYARRAQRVGATAWIAKERADELLPDALGRAPRRAWSPPPWREPTA